MKSLQGGDIETYANQLFRAWKLGEAKKNNGVLLLIAPAEHKVRIEVGYGLEGTLTDALSSVIIASAIVPRFKANDFPGGIERGVDGIIEVLTTDAADWQRKGAGAKRRPGERSRQVISVPVSVRADRHFMFFVTGNINTTPSGRMVNRNGRMVYVPNSGLKLGLGLVLRGGGFRPGADLAAAILRRRRIVGRRRRIGGLVMPITPEDHAAIAAAIRAAEQRTCGQIVCVLAHASSAYSSFVLIWAALLALFVPWPLIYLTPWSAQLIFLVQLAVFIVVALVVLMATAAHGAGAARAAARTRPSRRDRAVLHAPPRPHAQSHRRADLRLDGGTLCPHHRR